MKVETFRAYPRHGEKEGLIYMRPDIDDLIYGDAQTVHSER